MNELRLYADKCLTCQGGDRLYKVRQFAKEHNLEFKMKSAYIFPEIKAEAQEIGAKMPFIYLNGKTMSFYDVSPNLLIKGELDELV